MRSAPRCPPRAPRAVARAPLPASLLLPAVLLAACGPAAPPALPAPPPAPITSSAAPTATAALETPDEIFRYRPPVPAAVAPDRPPPAVVEATLPGGLRVLSIERRGSLVAVAGLFLRRDERISNPWLDELFWETLLEAKPGDGSPPLTAVLDDLGVRCLIHTHADGLSLNLAGTSFAIRDALSALVRSVARFSPTQADLDVGRARHLQHDEEFELVPLRAQGPLEERVRGAIFEHLLPADHRYREPPAKAADLGRVRLADLKRFASSVARPERAAVYAATEGAPEALRGAIEAAAAGWKRGPQAKTAAKPPKLARGVFLVEEEGAKDVTLAVVVPAPAAGDPHGWLWPLVSKTAKQVVFDEVNGAPDLRWGGGYWADQADRDLGFAVAVITVEPDSVAAGARVILEGLDHTAQGEIPDDLLAEQISLRLRSYGALEVDALEAQARLVNLLLLDMPSDAWSRSYTEERGAGRAGVIAAAGALLRRSEVRVIALGAVAGAEESLKALGLGPVSLTRPAKREAKKKP